MRVCGPLHIVLRAKKASREHLPGMTVCVRRCLTKLKLGVADGQPYFRAGGRTPPHPTLARCMAALTQRGARRKVRMMGTGSAYIATPYRDIDGLVWGIAALARCHPQQLRRKTGKRTTIRQTLAHACSPHELEYLANHGRFVAKNPDVGVPYGTTANEAYHRELKSMRRA